MMINHMKTTYRINGEHFGQFKQLQRRHDIRRHANLKQAYGLVFTAVNSVCTILLERRIASPAQQGSVLYPDCQ